MPTPLTLAIGGTFVAVALAAGSATSLILRRQVPARRRLRSVWRRCARRSW